MTRRCWDGRPLANTLPSRASMIAANGGHRYTSVTSGSMSADINMCEHANEQQDLLTPPERSVQ